MGKMENGCNSSIILNYPFLFSVLHMYFPFRLCCSGQMPYDSVPLRGCVQLRCHCSSPYCRLSDPNKKSIPSVRFMSRPLRISHAYALIFSTKNVQLKTFAAHLTVSVLLRACFVLGHLLSATILSILH